MTKAGTGGNVDSRAWPPRGATSTRCRAISVSKWGPRTGFSSPGARSAACITFYSIFGTIPSNARQGTGAWRSYPKDPRRKRSRGKEGPSARSPGKLGLLEGFRTSAARPEAGDEGKFELDRRILEELD